MRKIKNVKDLVIKIKRGKIPIDDLKGIMKYGISDKDRNYAISKLTAGYVNRFYFNPLPESDEEICAESAILYDDNSIIQELKWYFEIFGRYDSLIEEYLVLEGEIEKSFLLKSHSEVFGLLDMLDENICHSLYALNSEMLVNEVAGMSSENSELIRSIAEKSDNAKYIITLELARCRIDSKITYWQYDSLLEQQKEFYKNDPKQYSDYILYKYDPVWQEFEKNLDSIKFILSFEADLSIIDRYNTVKNLLPTIIAQKEILPEELKEILSIGFKFKYFKNDSFWSNIDSYINNDKLFEIPKRCQYYYEIERLFFLESFAEVVDYCAYVLESHPNFSENYLFFVKSLIITNTELIDKVNSQTELFKLLTLIINVLKKKSSYISDREKLLKHYYQISHFDYSYTIFEFLNYEYNLEVADSVKITSLLNIKPLRYNYFTRYKVVDLLIVDKLSQNYPTYKFIVNLHRENVSAEVTTLLQRQIRINLLLFKKRYEEALVSLIDLKKLNKLEYKVDFVESWIIKKFISCLFSMEKYSDSTEIVIENYFEKGLAFDHYFDKRIIDKLINLEIEECKSIAIPIFLHIYSLSQPIIYDGIANFLVAHDVFKPSELCSLELKFNSDQIIYFFEKVCTKDNIEDSPFLNTIDELDIERITILNYLKSINPIKIQNYNEEILKITKESSIRKGLIQIHESRIYVDIDSIYKIIEHNFQEIFSKYLDLTDINVTDITTIKISDNAYHDNSKVYYYFKEPIEEDLYPFYLLQTNPKYDKNAVMVPYMRYLYFLSMFEGVKKLFVFDESYGFKGFLSMRIRHGTFSNVLRSVFDKHKIVSSLEANSFEYKSVKYWDEKLPENCKDAKELQVLLKNFSHEIDVLIEKGLDWININSKENPSITGVFNFDYSSEEIELIFTNMLGRISDFEEFIKSIFSILYKRLDENLEILRAKISTNLTPRLLEAIDNLSLGIQALEMNSAYKKLIEQEIVGCRTDIQIVTADIANWFRISYSQHIKEFHLEMILQTSLNYIDNINTGAISKSKVTLKNKCSAKFHGKYFESFGDIFINLFDNILAKNRELEDELIIDIEVTSEEHFINIMVKNNLSQDVDRQAMAKAVDDIKYKVDNYKKDVPVGFEKGSGYLKICNCLANGLNLDNYKIQPTYDSDFFQVVIQFNISNLII